NGRFVILQGSPPDTDLWILPMTADGKLQEDAKPKRYLRTPFNERSGRFSPEPNPRWVAYDSNESGRDEVCIDAFPEPRGKIRISRGGGRYPQWGAGGRELFYLSPENKLMAVNLKLGADSVQPDAPRELFPLPELASVRSPYEASSDG